MIRWAAAGLCVWAGISIGRAEDWPTYQHDPQRSACSGENLAAAGLRSDWLYRSPAPPQPAWDGAARWDAYARLRPLKSMREYDPVYHVSVAGRSLYFGSSADDTVRCLDTRTGEERWSYTTDGAVRIAPAYWNGRVFFGSDDGHAYCLDAADGHLIWKFQPSPTERLVLLNGRFIPFWPCRTGVLVDGGTAYFAVGMLPWKESYLCAVDALTGKPEGPGRFVRRLEAVTLEGAMLASSRKLISPQGRVAPLLFNRPDGAPLGGLQGGGGCFVLVTPDEHVLHGPGNKTGWIQESSERDRSKIATFNGGNAMVVRGATSYVLTDTVLMAMDRATRKEIWSRTNRCTLALIAGGEVLYAGGDERVAAYRAFGRTTSLGKAGGRPGLWLGGGRRRPVYQHRRRGDSIVPRGGGGPRPGGGPCRGTRARGANGVGGRGAAGLCAHEHSRVWRGKRRAKNPAVGACPGAMSEVRGCGTGGDLVANRPADADGGRVGYAGCGDAGSWLLGARDGSYHDFDRVAAEPRLFLHHQRPWGGTPRREVRVRYLFQLFGAENAVGGGAISGGRQVRFLRGVRAGNLGGIRH